MNIKEWFGKRIYRLLSSFFLALVMLFVSYWLTNKDTASSGEGEIIRNTRAIFDVIIGEKKDAVPDSIVLINVSFDRQLIAYEDELGIPAGEIDITDRTKLINLLDWLTETGKYKAILLDIFFDDRFYTEADSSLYDKLLSMPRIAIPNHTDAKLADNRLSKKSGLSEYYVNLFHGDLNKVPIVDPDGNPAVSTFLFSQISGKEYSKLGPFYFEENKLIRRCVYPDYSLNIINPYDERGNKTYLNIGADLLENKDILGPSFFDGKYIVIGSFERLDMHNTSAGSMSGSLINFNIFLSLLHGRQHISFWFTLIVFVLFWMLSFYIITDGLYGHKPRYLARLWAAYSIILIIGCALTYLIYGEAIDIFLTSTIFTFIHKGLQMYRYIKNKK